MKNQIFKIILISFAFFCFFNTAYADTTIHLKISTPTSTIYDQDIPVAPCDNDNNGETIAIATPYCAILQLQPEIQSDWSWNDTYSAYFLNSINNISGSVTQDNNGNDVYHYWSWSIGPDVAMVGLSSYELNPNDLISLDFIDPVPEPLPSGNNGLGGGVITPTIETTISAIPEVPFIPEVPSIPLVKPTFDLKKAFDFLFTQQKENGSFGEDLYTDWIALALASGNYQDQTIKLIKYFGEYKNENMSLTDSERHAMALMSLGLNPYNTNGKNYIEKIITSFDGIQFGDINEDNDDIFALIVLQNVGYLQDEKIIKNDISFILSKQKEDGSWDGNVDMTGAAIEALAAFSPTPGVGESLAKAREFLRQKQKETGGWNNASSTAWAIEGILALGEKVEDWKKNDPAIDGASNTPLDYLATVQDTDGGIKNLSTEKEGENIQNKIWETAYVASALSGKTWNQIMQKFEKIEKPIENKIIVNIPKKILKKEMLTATVINTITPPSITTETTQTEIPKKSWFRNFLDKIFSSF